MADQNERDQVRLVQISGAQIEALGGCAAITGRLAGSYEVYGGVEPRTALKGYDEVWEAWQAALDASDQHFDGRAYGAQCFRCRRIVAIHMLDPRGPVELREWNEGVIEFFQGVVASGGDRLRLIAMLPGEWRSRLGRCVCEAPA